MIRRSALISRVFLCFLVLGFSSEEAGALYNLSLTTGPEEAFPLVVSAQGIGLYEVNALIDSEEQVKLPVSALMEVMKIPCRRDTSSGEFQVWWPARKEPTILSLAGTVRFDTVEITLQPGEVRYFEGDVFLALESWETVFGIKASFSFQQLIVQLEGDFGSLRRHSGGVLPGMPDKPTPGLILASSGRMLYGGMLDYQLNYHAQGGEGLAEARMLAGFGIFGGNLQAGIYFRTRERFDWRRQLLHWRILSEKGKIFRKWQVGHLEAGTIVRPWRPLIGILAGNAPDTLRVGGWSYQVQAGYLERERGGWFLRPEMAFLINPRLRVGAGLEHFSVWSGAVPWIRGNYTLEDDLLLGMEYAHGARTLVNVAGRLSNIFSLDYSMERYPAGQKLLLVPYQARQRLALQGRHALQGTFAGTSLEAEWIRGNDFVQAAFQALVSVIWKGGQVQLATRYTYLPPNVFALVSMAGFSHKLGRNSQLRISSQFLGTKLRMYGLEAEWSGRISSYAELILGYREGFQRGGGEFSVQVAWNLGVLRSFSAFTAQGRGMELSQGLSGSLRYDDAVGRIMPDARSRAGTGGIALLPFVDINHNGYRDAGEPAAKGLVASLEGRPSIGTSRDTLLRFDYLPAGKDYLIILEKKGLEDIFWSFRHEVIQVRVEAYHFRSVEIPVLPGHEIYGVVSGAKEVRGISRSKVYLFDQSGRRLRHTWPDTDGSYAFSGLPPGSYILATVDDFTAPDARQVKINPSVHGQQIGPVEW